MSMTDADIARVAHAFLDCTLPKAEWTHAAHFATALWLLIERPDTDMEQVMMRQIPRYNESVGGVNSGTSGYHATITIASARMARALLNGLSGDATPALALDALMASPLGDKGWPLAYWSATRLWSVEARRGWVEPDIAPLPL